MEGIYPPPSNSTAIKKRTFFVASIKKICYGTCRGVGVGRGWESSRIILLVLS